MTTTDGVRSRAHAAAAARIGVVGVASSMTLGLIAVMGAAPPAGEPATAVAPLPPTTTTVASPPPPPIVIIVRRPAAVAAPAPPRASAPRAVAPAPPRPAPVAAPQPLTQTSAS
jgi:hypothetical protein